MRKVDTYNKRWELEEAARGMVQLLKGRERSVADGSRSCQIYRCEKAPAHWTKKMHVRMRLQDMRREERYHMSERLEEPG